MLCWIIEYNTIQVKYWADTTTPLRPRSCIFIKCNISFYYYTCNLVPCIKIIKTFRTMKQMETRLSVFKGYFKWNYAILRRRERVSILIQHHFPLCNKLKQFLQLLNDMIFLSNQIRMIINYDHENVYLINSNLLIPETIPVLNKSHNFSV